MEERAVSGDRPAGSVGERWGRRNSGNLAVGAGGDLADIYL